MPQKKEKKIYVVIPAYNESKRIAPVLKALVKLLFPVVVVDDGSKDKTYGVAKGVSGVVVIRHGINLGKGAAMKTGCEAAFEMGAEAIIFMDADGQHQAQDLEKFITALDRGFEVVFGSRNLSHGVPIVRYLGNKFASVFVSLLFGVYISDLICGYRALTKAAYEEIKWDSKGYAVETEMVIRTAKKGLKHCEVPVATLYLDNVKGVTILDAINTLFDVLLWRLTL